MQNYVTDATDCMYHPLPPMYVLTNMFIHMETVGLIYAPIAKSNLKNGLMKRGDLWRLRMVQLKQISYEEERLAYFQAKKQEAEKRYKKVEKVVNSMGKDNLSYLSKEIEALSDAGRELSFYADVVEMLEERNTK